MRKLEIASGTRYGNLTVAEEVDRTRSPDGKSHRVWLCQCDCGKTKEIPQGKFTSGHTTSCGCALERAQKTQPRGPDSPHWKGGRTVSGEGYIRVYQPDHPRAGGVYVLEHILVMEEKLGRRLFGDENVHHLNGDKADNRPENLELWSTSQPKGQRVVDKVEWARELVSRYSTVHDALKARLHE